VSQGLTQLVDSSVPTGSPAAGQAISAQPYGYGNDLANWAQFVTKAVVRQELSPRWTVSTSAVHYSGFGGAKDYAAYASTFASPPSAIPLSDPGFDTPYGPNLYWNAGLEFRPTQDWNVRLDGYNLVAPMDRTLSKRNHYFRMSEYNLQPASLAVSIRHRF
jgi:iron complex outermembrane receptor protein